MKLSLEDQRTLTFAGTTDALGLICLIAGILLCNPYFSDLNFMAKSLAILILMLFSGILWFPQKIKPFLDKRFFFPVDEKLRIESSPIPIPEAEALGSGLLIGYTTDNGMPVYIPYSRLSQHMALIGQSGVGKTVCGTNLMTQHIRNGGGYLFIDGKLSSSELENVIMLAKWAGREQDVYILNAANPEQSNTYNPILYGDPQEVASRIISLIPEGSAGTDHYRSSAKQAIETIVAAFQRLGKPYNFMDISMVLMEAQTIYIILKELNSKYFDDPVTAQFKMLINRYRDKDGRINVEEFRKTLGGLAGRLHEFATGSFGQVMNTYNPELKLYDAIMQHKIIYVMLPTMGKNEQSISLAKMIIADLRTAISWIQKLPDELKPNPPYFVFPDEAGSYIDKNWTRPLEQSRSAGIFFCPAFQTFANLETDEKENKEMILGNTYTKIFYKLGTNTTATEASEMLGNRRRTTYAIGEGHGASISGAEVDTSPIKNQGDSAASTTMQRDEEVAKVTPEQFMALPIGECIVFYDGNRIYHLKTPIFKITPEARKVLNLDNNQLNRFVMPEVEGLDLFEKVKNLLN